MRPLLRIGDLPEVGRWEEIPYITIHSTGILFCNDEGGFNAHWYDLRHPWQRYSRGDYRWVFFFKQVARGIRVVFTGRTPWA